MKIKNLLVGSIILSSTLFAGGDIIPVEPAIEEVVQTNAWSFELEPYLMITNIEGDTSMGRVTGVPVSVDFGDILENLDMAFMGHFEAHHQSGWGLWLDYGFMDLGPETDGPFGGVISAGVRQGVLEAVALYRQELGNEQIDYFCGIRWWDNDIDVTVDPAVLPGSITASKDIDWVDFIIGTRWTHPINENWKFRLRGDIGAGGADFTATTTAGFIYTINDLMDIDVTYKGTWVDYEEGTQGTRDYFAYDTLTHGLILGLNFKF